MEYFTYCSNIIYVKEEYIMRMPALPQSKMEVEKKEKRSFFQSIRTFFSKKFTRKQKTIRIPPRE